MEGLTSVKYSQAKREAIYHAWESQDVKNLHRLAREHQSSRRTIRRIIASGLAGSNGKVSPTSGGPHEPNEKLFSLNSDQPRTLEEALSAAHVSNEWEVER